MVESHQVRRGGGLRVVFFGSPLFAVPTLRALAGNPLFEVALVVTQGARTPSPVELAARELALPVYTPDTLRDTASRQPLVTAGADLFVVAAFGLIFRQSTLDIPQLGAINIHPSLLPRYRGASPIAAAIAAGDHESGVSLMVMDAGIDTGAVVSMERVGVDAEDTTESLGTRLAELGAAQAVRDIPRWADGKILAAAQDDAGASLTRTLSKADGWLDWDRPAAELARHVRAMWPWPRAWTTIDGSSVQVHQARVRDPGEDGLAPGIVSSERKRLIVGCGGGALELLSIDPAGRRPMSGGAYLNGRRTPLTVVGERCAPPPTPPLVLPVASGLAG